MAVFTPLSLTDADRVCRAHGLDACLDVRAIPEGSVNSNFFVTTSSARYFLRIYEEQGHDGVAYEWALLDHLRAAGVPVPRRIGDAAPGVVRVAGKPVVLFEAVHGEHACQASVNSTRAAAIGAQLARVHLAGQRFGWRKAGRFGLEQVVRKLDAISYAEHPELIDISKELRDATAQVCDAWPASAPQGLIHGDLFRDNVYWDGERITALLDWESASDGLFGYDLMVTLLAWCYGDQLRWDLASSLVAGYLGQRPMSVEELRTLRTAGLAAAIRFTITRITDFHLRRGIGDRVHKDFRRFHDRMHALQRLTSDELVERLLER